MASRKPTLQTEGEVKSFLYMRLKKKKRKGKVELNDGNISIRAAVSCDESLL